MTEARDRMLGRLRAAPRHAPLPLPDWAPAAAGDLAGRFRRAAEAWRAEVHDVAEADWPAMLRTLLAGKGVGTLLCAPTTAAGQCLAADDGLRLVPYDAPVEDMKETLLHGVAAGFTTAAAAIAETGTLVLSPTPEEPRLMSLLPPIHVALLRAADIRENLAGYMRERQAPMPTNLVFVTGPSKTADIEQTLAFGVHGPKELVVLIVS